MVFRKATIGWSDMFPNILDEEILLVDDSIKPKIGDVILYKKDDGQVFPHRIIHKFKGYYFTRGDNLKLINLPSKIKDFSGIVVGKKGILKISKKLKFFLNLILFYFIIFNPKSPKKERAMKFISDLASLSEITWYPNKYDNDLVNRSIYNLKRDKIPDNYSQMNLRYAIRKCFENKISLNSWFFKKANPIVYKQKLKKRKLIVQEFEKLKKKLDKDKIKYVLLKGMAYGHVRDMADVDLLTNKPEKIERILHSFGYSTKNKNNLEIECFKDIREFPLSFDIHKRFPSISHNFSFPLENKFSLSNYDKFLICCTHTYQQGRICLRDIVDLNELLKKISVKEIKLENKGLFELLGCPLIITHLFDKKYNNEKNKKLAKFVKKNYSKELPIFIKYLEERRWEMPLHLLHFYKKTKIFPTYKFLKEPREYAYEGSRLHRFLIRLIVNFKNLKIKKYIYKEK